MDDAAELDRELAGQDVQGLLERVDVPPQPAARCERPTASSVWTAPWSRPTRTSRARPDEVAEAAMGRSAKDQSMRPT